MSYANNRSMMGVMGMCEYKQLLDDAAEQIKIFERPSKANSERLIEAVKTLEQQLKTARKEAFIAGVIKGNPSAEGRSTVEEAAEEYANNLEGK